MVYGKPRRKINMIKNMTRKGLALGSTVALLVSGLVGIAAPAQAATLSAVIPTAGTSTTFVSGEVFKLKALGNLVSGDSLRWIVTGVDETLTIAATGGTANVVTDGTTRIVTPAGIIGTPGGNELHLNIAADKADVVTVRAYIESGDAVGYNAAFDTIASAPVDVTFVKPGDVVPTIVFDAPTVADTTVKATVSFNVNNEQLENLSGELTYANGTDITVTSPAVAAWSATNKFAFTATVAAGLAADQAVKLQMKLDTPVNLGAASTAAVVKRTSESFELSTVTGVNVTEAAGTDTAETRRNTTFSMSVAAEDKATFGATGNKAVANAKVTVSFATSVVLAATGASAKSIVIGGTSFTDKDKLPGVGTVAPVSLTTGADGSVSWTIATTGFAADDAFTVTAKVENLATQTITVTAKNPTYTLYITPGLTQSVVAGGTASLQAAVYDQFGGVPAAGYDVRAIFDEAASDVRTGTGAKKATSASSNNAAVVNGLATISITDNGVGTGTSVYDLEFSERVAGGGYAAASATIADYALEIVSAAPVAGDITLSAGAAADGTTKVYARTGTLSQKDNGVYDARGVLGSAPTHVFDTALDGNVKTAVSSTAAQAAIAGAAVTLTGTGLQFKTEVNGKDVFAVGSITVYTDASGNYVADVASNKAGKQIVTITSGAASRTVEVTFSAAGSQTGANLTIDAPASVSAGSTMKVTVKVTDKYGNPVNTANAVSPSTGVANLVVAYTGPGLVVGSGVGAIATETNDDGEIVFTVLMGSNDSGTATVTARHRLTASNDNVNDVVVQKTVTIGTAGNAGDYSSWTKKLDDNSAKIYAKNVVGEGKVQFFLNGKEIAWVRATSAADSKLRTANGSSYLVRTVEFAAGKNVLEVYVDGVRTTRTAYTK
jgi:hypothetical protein